MLLASAARASARRPRPSDAASALSRQRGGGCAGGAFLPARRLHGQTFAVGSLALTPRTRAGSAAAQALRRESLVPGIVYGFDAAGGDGECGGGQPRRNARAQRSSELARGGRPAALAICPRPAPSRLSPAGVKLVHCDEADLRREVNLRRDTFYNTLYDVCVPHFAACGCGCCGRRGRRRVRRLPRPRAAPSRAGPSTARSCARCRATFRCTRSGPRPFL